jgi:putative transposase
VIRRGRFTEDQIIGVLSEHETGVKTADLCRKHGISDATFYNWKSKYGGMTVSEAARLRTLEDENRRLKKLLAESMLYVSALKDLLGKTDSVCRALHCSGEADGRSRLLRASRLQADRGQSVGMAI